MILWWIGNVVLLVVLPVVIYLLRGVLEAARSIVRRAADLAAAAAGSRTSTRPRCSRRHQDQVQPDHRGRRELRRLARRDPRRRSRRGSMNAAGTITILAVALILAALVYYLVSRDRAAAEDHRGPGRRHCRREWDRREERARQRGRDDHQPAARRGRRPARGSAREEGRAVRCCRPRRGPLPWSRRSRARTSQSSTIEAPRIGEVYTKGTLTLARLGREAPIGREPTGPALRDVEEESRGADAVRRSVRRGPSPSPSPRHRHRRACSTRAGGHREPRKHLPTGVVNLVGRFSVP